MKSFLDLAKITEELNSISRDVEVSKSRINKAEKEDYSNVSTSIAALAAVTLASIALTATAAIAGSWQQREREWLYMSDQGVPAVGCQQIDSNIYYFDPNGIMQVGPQCIDSKWFFFDDNPASSTYGALQHGSCVINGVGYTINDDGTIAGYTASQVISEAGQPVIGQTKVENGRTYQYQNTPAGPQWISLSGDEFDSLAEEFEDVDPAFRSIAGATLPATIQPPPSSAPVNHSYSRNSRGKNTITDEGLRAAAEESKRISDSLRGRKDSDFRDGVIHTSDKPLDI